MENHTKRIRKARRQGFQRRDKDLELPTPSHSRFERRSEGTPQALPGARRRNARKRSLTTTRKTKRQRPVLSRTRTNPKTRSRA